MNYKKLNEILSNLENPGDKLKLISSDEGDNFYEGKNQGQEGLKVEIFDIQEDGVFLKVVTKSDSYGSNEKVSSIQFVAAQEKTITEFKEI